MMHHILRQRLGLAFISVLDGCPFKFVECVSLVSGGVSLAAYV